MIEKKMQEPVRSVWCFLQKTNAISVSLSNLSIYTIIYYGINFMPVVPQCRTKAPFFQPFINTSLMEMMS